MYLQNANATFFSRMEVLVSLYMDTVKEDMQIVSE